MANKQILIILISALLLNIPISLFGQVRYVKEGGTGDGSSWANASGDIQDMIEEVYILGGGEVWIANGTYNPTSRPNGGGNQQTNYHFSMRSNVIIYGGFPDFDSPTMTDRSPLAYPTILSGDFNNNDEYSPEGYPINNLSDNATRIFNHEGINLNSNAILDGVVISGCAENGAAMYSDGGTFEQIIRNCSFKQNKSSAGVIRSDEASIEFINCAFYQNSAEWNGSACVFETSYNAVTGGNSSYTNCSFYNNYILGNNIGPAATIQGTPCSVEFINCTFSNNKNNATTSDAVSIISGNVQFTNCISWDNDGSNGLYGSYSSTNCIFQDIGGATDPYLDPDGILINGGMVPTIAIIDENSPAIDAGTDTGAPGNDARGFTRQEISGIGGTNITDIGAFEYQAVANMLQIFTLDLISSDKNQALAIGRSYYAPIEPPSQKGFTWSISNSRPLITTDDYSTEPDLTTEDYNYLINHSESPTLYARAYAISNDGTRVIYGNVLSINIRYVKEGGSGAGNGLSWADASGDFQGMIEEVYDSGNGKGEVWVAAGTYAPNSWPNSSSTNPNECHFSLRANVTIFGGFPNTGNPGLSDRSPLDHPSILSGDVNGDDTYDADGFLNGNLSDNIEHIFWHNDITLDQTAILDGFTITNGYNSGGEGAAIYNSNSNAISLVLKNLIIEKNSSPSGAVYNNTTGVIYSNCTFTKNQSNYNGATIFEVSNNKYCLSELLNCTFVDNKTLGSTAGIKISGGQMYSKLYNCTFYNNNIGTGNIISGNIGYLTAYNCIFWENNGGHGLTNTSLSSNGILQGIDTDPSLDAANGLTDNGGMVPTIAIDAGSSAIDAANDAYAPDTDARGIARVNTGGTSVADIGAYEYNDEFIWTGTYSSDWNVGQNWSSSTIPDASLSVRIPELCDNYPEIESPITQDGITIDNNAKLDIMPDGQLSVPGTLTNNGELTIHSDASGTGSLIHNSTGIEASVERYIDGSKWHMIYPPLSNIPNSILATAPWGDNNPNYYYYNETTEDYWIGTSNNGTSGWTSAGNTGSMGTGKGYLYYFPSNITYTLTGGTIAVDDITFSGLSYTEHSSSLPAGNNWSTFDGWQLIGNPYSAAIDLSQINTSTDLSNLNHAIYVYNQNIDNYQYYELTDGSVAAVNLNINGNQETADNIIPAHQGFFVKVMSGASTGSLMLKASSRVHDNKPVYKNTKASDDIIRIGVKYNDNFEETVIRLKDGANNQFEKTDILKRFSWNQDIPQIYTLTNNNIEMAVNSLSMDEFDTNIPFAFYDNSSGEKEIIFLSNNLENKHVYFLDKYNKTATPINEGATFSFNHEAGKCTDRFEIQIHTNNAPIAEGSIESKSYSLNNDINISFSKELFNEIDQFDFLEFKCLQTNGEAIPDHLWFNKDNLTLIGTASQIEVLHLSLIATDKFGAQASIDFEISISNATSSERIDEERMLIYPNPCKNAFTIQSPDNCYYSITDINGKIVYQSELSKGSNYIITKLTPGVYFVKREFQDSSEIEKLVILE